MVYGMKGYMISFYAGWECLCFPLNCKFGNSVGGICQFSGCFSLSFSSFTFLLKRPQSQSKALLHGKDTFALAHIIVQIPPMELNDLQTWQSTTLGVRLSNAL